MDIHFYRGSTTIEMGATTRYGYRQNRRQLNFLHSRPPATANSKVLEVAGSGCSTRGLGLRNGEQAELPDHPRGAA